MDIQVVDLLSSDDEEEDNNVVDKQMPVKQEPITTPTRNASVSNAETNRAHQENGHQNNDERENNPSTSHVNESAVALKRMLNECLSIENSSSMVAIVEKIWKSYNRLNPTYRDSTDFVMLINDNHSSIVDEPKNKCKFMKIVKDEMDYHRNLKRRHCSDKKSSTKKACDSSPHPSTSNHYSESSNDATPAIDSDDEVKKKKKARHLKQLWKSYFKIQKRIKVLESLEVDWDDDDDSYYLQEDRYKKKLVAIYNKIQELTDNSLGKILRKKIFFNETEYPKLNLKVEKFINKKRAFPDFHDVEEVILEGNKEFGLSLSDADIHTYAVRAFESIGKQMKKHRCHELQENLGLLLPETVTDPAEKDLELEKKLKENQEQYKNREAELMTQFTQKSEELVKEREKKIKEGVPVEEEKSDNESEEEEEEEEEEENQPQEDFSDHSSESSDSEAEENEDLNQIDEEETQDVPDVTPKDATGYVSTPGDTPEEIFISSQDDNTQSFHQTNSQNSNSSGGIKVINTFSLAETSEKLPVESTLLNEKEKISAMKILDLQISRIDDTIIKPTTTTSFADAFKQHLELRKNDDITDIPIANNNKSTENIDENIPTVNKANSNQSTENIDENIPIVNDNINNNQITEETVSNNDTKITVSKITPKKSENFTPLLSVSPKLTVDIPSTLHVKPQYKVQKARKSFPRFQPPVTLPKIEPEEKKLQTPEISSSSQDNKMDSDDDCIVLSD